MPVCDACSTSCPENSGRFCPECGAVLAALSTSGPSEVIELVHKPKSTPAQQLAGHVVQGTVAGIQAERASTGARVRARSSTDVGPSVPPSARPSSSTEHASGRAASAHDASAAANPRSSTHDASAAPNPPASNGRDSSTAVNLIGTRLDGFAIEGIVGGGAFGTVYRGRQIGLDRVVAIKVPTMEIAADPVMAKRFGREARAAARVNHPGVVSIYQVGELPDGRPYLAMQLLEGEPLDRILADGPIPVVRALEIARQIASALSETHAVGVVHRDLKPTNIMWRRDRNGDDRLTLVDFGIAVCRPGNADATRLTSGGLIGTPHYMSPEQAHGEIVDARADLYALGCLLFELVTGVTPFDGSGFEVLLAHLGRPPPRPSEREPSIPEIVDQLVLQLMEKRPDDRIATADAVVERIDEILDVLADPSAAPPRPAPGLADGRPQPRPKKPTAPTRREPPLDADPVAATHPSTPTVDARRAVALDDVPTTKPRPARFRWFAIGALVTATACAGAYLALGLERPGERVRGVEERDTSTIRRRELFRDDGETIVRMWVPDPFVVGRSRIHVELRNKLGAKVQAETLIVTIEDPDKRAIGITARPRQVNPDQFGFAHEFKVPGTYRMRIFTPEDETRRPAMFEIDLDIAPRP